MVDYSNLFVTGYGTASLADAAFRAGVDVAIVDPGISALDRNSKLGGRAFPVEANNDLVSIMDAVDAASPGDVVVIANKTMDVAVIGDLIATDAARKGLGGFVVEGRVRDAIELVALGVPVFSRGRYPVGPLKLPPALRSIGVVGEPVLVGGVMVHPGSWVFGDADGLILLEQETLEKVFEGAELASLREADLAAEVSSGTPLADALQVREFVAKRTDDPDADFNSHLDEIGRAI